ncbi:uncharacterized protein A1O5_11596 [Cladophialophora psammophila CBS 110553]|uniref:Protein kinase domain-containing protein n=1 Tax=Cladophialophora psammophila CBS 110553 TaxID=1182543 RepID=W9WE42_9EURO|nr:uncharacterized protein A1O5_11596 [Cladophialophora psammophila CBS 110553]EXJ63275.1 hypothetical protein A1O5_11596 [Cladophialophora psammophila CBS 110553]
MGSDKEDQPSQNSLNTLAKMVAIKAIKNGEALRQDKVPEIQAEELEMKSPGMAVWNKMKEAVYVEGRNYQHASDAQQNQRSPEDHVLQLARLLYNSEWTALLLSLDCVGIVRRPDVHQIDFIYRLPGQLGKSKPLSPYEDTTFRGPKPLSELLSTPTFQLTLAQKFEVGKRLVESISLMHANGWLHKNLRASSVIFFPQESSDAGLSDRPLILKRPHISRFEFSRPEPIQSEVPARGAPGSTSRLEELLRTAPRPSMISLPINWNEGQAEARTGDLMSANHAFTSARAEIQLDYYHHPAKFASLNRHYCYAYDGYSLGILLIEIGCSNTMLNLEKILNQTLAYTPINAPYDVRRNIYNQVIPYLMFLCGDLYAEAVGLCLMLEPLEDDQTCRQQQELCVKVAAILERCCA